MKVRRRSLELGKGEVPRYVKASSERNPCELWTLLA
jgi:hypothetical protein